MTTMDIRLWLLVVTICWVKLKCSAESKTRDAVTVVKRNLRWEKNNGYFIVPEDAGTPRLTIRFYEPHPSNEDVLDNQNYLSFVLYQADGHRDIPSNTGLFHFIGDAYAENNRWNCARPTMHAGAYYHFYGKCPETETGVVAAGYCSKNGKLFFNSMTFNSKGMQYMDNKYYLNPDRDVAMIEQQLLTDSFEEWKGAGFPKDNWVYTIPSASRMRRFIKDNITASSLDDLDCPCDDPCIAAASTVQRSHHVWMMAMMALVMGGFC